MPPWPRPSDTQYASLGTPRLGVHTVPKSSADVHWCRRLQGGFQDDWSSDMVIKATTISSARYMCGAWWKKISFLSKSKEKEFVQVVTECKVTNVRKYWRGTPKTTSLDQSCHNLAFTPYPGRIRETKCAVSLYQRSFYTPLGKFIPLPYTK